MKSGGTTSSTETSFMPDTVSIYSAPGSFPLIWGSPALPWPCFTPSTLAAASLKPTRATSEPLAARHVTALQAARAPVLAATAAASSVPAARQTQLTTADAAVQRAGTYSTPSSAGIAEFTPAFFDESSQAWRANKKALPSGQFAYVDAGVLTDWVGGGRSKKRRI